MFLTILTVPFFFLCLSATAISQNITSQIVVTGRSLAVEPATNNTAAPGGVTTFLTTYDNWDGSPLFPFSGEVRPYYLGSSEYVTDYEGHLGIMNPAGSLVNYGQMVISNMPVGIDSDGDGLPDFLEVNQSGTFITTGADREDWKWDNQLGNSSWIFSFNRAAGNYQGTYFIRKATDPDNQDKHWNGNFQLKGGTGNVVFNTNSRAFSFHTLSFDTIYPETNNGTGTYGVTSSGQILASGFWMNSSFGTNHRVYINPFLIQRIGDTHRGRGVIYAADGHPPATGDDTTYADYTEFHLEVTNLPASLPPNPVISGPEWNDNFSTNSSANYLDFRASHFARMEVTNSRLSFISSANPYGNWYGNECAYSPPHLLLPLDASWNVIIQAALPTPDTNTIFRYVLLGLAPENETYNISNFRSTGYTIALKQDDESVTRGSLLATFAQKDWLLDPTIGKTNNVNLHGAFLRLSFDSRSKKLAAFYDPNTIAGDRTWTKLEELSIDPADPNSMATSLGLDAHSKIRVGLGIDNYTTNAVPVDQVWLDNLAISVTPLPPPPLTNGLRAYLDQAFSYTPVWSNSPVSFSAANLPPGLTNNALTGVISGTPTLAGYYRVIQTAYNAHGSTDFIIPITLFGAPLTLPFSDDFSAFVPNQYMPYDVSDILEPEPFLVPPLWRPPAGRLSLQPTNGVLRVICPNYSPGYHSIGWVPNLALPLSSSWELKLDVKMPNDYETKESQLGFSLSPSFGPDITVETDTSSLNELNFYFNRDTEFPDTDPYKEFGSSLERSVYTNGQSITNKLLRHPTYGRSQYSRATLRIVYNATAKTISTWGLYHEEGSWTQIGEDIDFNTATTGSLAHAWGLTSTSSLSVILSGYFELYENQTLPEIYADNFSAEIIQNPHLPPFFNDQHPNTISIDGLTYLMKYAYGAADPTSPISQSLRPIATLTNNGSGQSVLALTYFSRTNDAKLSTLPVWHTNLSGAASTWSNNVTVTLLSTTNTNGLTLERRQATVPVDSNSKKFLRLKATLNQ